MKGITPTEGQALLMRMAYQGPSPDRAADMELLLICNRTISEALTYGQLIEPTGAGYERLTLFDSRWEVRGSEAARYPAQRWTVGPKGWAGKVTGYAIVTRAERGGVPRVLHAELAQGEPQAMQELDTYEVEPIVAR